MNTTTARLILASGSPRRAQLMADNGYLFEIIKPALDEPDESGPEVPPAQHAEALSYYKARCVANTYQGPDAIILGADTVVAHDGHIYGKPADADDARAILSTLAGTTHEVITGVTVLRPAADIRFITHEVTHVTMRPMPSDVLERYIASRAWEGKAGAYGIQDHGDAYVERINGSFTNVVGLPMSTVARLLQGAGYVCEPVNHAH
ncbi:MAG: septum formation protein Maf [Phycisphaerae bacterium]|nr:septum formation protein Maf [Phycisphaerae bacterium]